jgi:hypothetical protein
MRIQRFVVKVESREKCAAIDSHFRCDSTPFLLLFDIASYAVSPLGRTSGISLLEESTFVTKISRADSVTVSRQRMLLREAAIGTLKSLREFTTLRAATAHYVRRISPFLCRCERFALTSRFGALLGSRRVGRPRKLLVYGVRIVRYESRSSNVGCKNDDRFDRDRNESVRSADDRMAFPRSAPISPR